MKTLLTTTVLMIALSNVGGANEVGDILNGAAQVINALNGQPTYVVNPRQPIQPEFTPYQPYRPFRPAPNVLPGPNVLPAPMPNPNVHPPRPWGPYHNPTIREKRSTGLRFNPITGRYERTNNAEFIKESAMDPNRGIIDPGSLRTRTSVRYEGNREIHTTVRTWTSYGVPHSKTSQQVKVHNSRGTDTFNTDLLTSPAPAGI